MGKAIVISGAGCSLIDNLYNKLDFSGDNFRKYLSKNAGDGGLTPGQLVLTEDFEKFTGENINISISKIVGNRPPDVFNIGGPGGVALINTAQLTYNIDTIVNYYGARGDDVDGNHIAELLSKTPLNLSHYKISKKPSPYTIVFSDPWYDNGHGERTFINNIGAAWDLHPEDLDDEFFSSDIVVFGATALVPNIHDNLASLLKKAKQRGCITVVNTVYDFRNEKKNPGKKWPLGESDESYRYTDLLIVDHEEALRLSGTRNVDDAAAFFIKQQTGGFAITYGVNPILVYSSGNLFQPQSLVKIPVSEKVRIMLKEHPEIAGDTTGCGDNFAGGMIASLAMQIYKEIAKPDIIEAALWGVASGGFACFYVGGTWFEKNKGEKLREVLPIYNDLASR